MDPNCHEFGLQNLLNRIKNDGVVKVNSDTVHDWDRRQGGSVVVFTLNDSDERYRIKNVGDGKVVKKLLLI